jgi:TetR/AcrR family transcriptional regulator, ethionamide resistance regulator
MRPRGRKQALQGDARQRELVAALIGLLNDGSLFGELGVNDIAKRAGITRSAFYFYFTCKEDALIAALSDFRDRLMEAAQPFLDGDDDDLQRSAESALLNLARVRRAHGPLVRAMSESAATNRDCWKMLRNLFESTVPPGAARVMQIREQRGAPLPREDAEELVRALIWSNERNFYRAMVEDFDQTQWRTLVKTLTTIWMSVLLSGAPTKRPRPRRSRARSR